MYTFDAHAHNCVAIMYPTGGYGNFLYFLLTEYLECTVKPQHQQWQFSNTGDSHAFPKYVETFVLGSHVQTKNAKNFVYRYGILDHTVKDQIEQGKKFMVLADVGNTGDNTKFLRRYFPNAQIIRVYTQNFVEKLILWTNCMTKSGWENQLYPGSIMPASGIALWANKSVDEITDEDAVGCMLKFFNEDFGKYGKFFCQPKSDTINVRISSFFDKQSILDMLQRMAAEFDTHIIKSEGLERTIVEFLKYQSQLSLLDPTSQSFPLVRRAIEAYENTVKS